MKKAIKIFSLLIALLCSSLFVSSCEVTVTVKDDKKTQESSNQNQGGGTSTGGNSEGGGTSTGGNTEGGGTTDPNVPISNPDEDPIDYAGLATLKTTGNTSVYMEVTVKLFIDGDTTHFNVPTTFSSDGTLKARYLGVNTPESTGKIEEYGKQASNYTKSKLASATSIIVESDDGNWNVDSTGGRYLVWVWYKTADSSSYRNLNIELLQEGLAIASNSANNKYGTYCVNAISQAQERKLKIYSGEKDPLFYYGDAIVTDLRTIRLHIADYKDKKVAFEGNVVKTYSQGVYLEEYYEEEGLYYGFYAYLGYGAPGYLEEIMSIGNRVRVVGKIQLYEAGGTYQIAGLTYSLFAEDPSELADNTSLIGTVGSATKAQYQTVTIDQFNETLNIDYVSITTDPDTEEEVINHEPIQVVRAECMLNASVKMDNLYVASIYTTQSGNSAGCKTLTCTCNGKTIKIRTTFTGLVDEDYLNKVVSVKGFVDYYDGTYQIELFSKKLLTVTQ